MFIKSWIYLDDEYVVMTRNKFLQYTQLLILEFRDTLIQHMESVKKSIDERALHKREYDTRVNERQIQTTEGKIDTGNAMDASLVNTESSGTESKEQDTSSRSGNDAHADDADIKPIYDEEPMAENAEQCHDTCPLPAKLTYKKTTELTNQSLESENICLKKTVAQFQKDFSRMEAHCVNLELKYQNQVLKDGQHGQFLQVKSNEAKVKHDIDVIETINIELEHKVAKLLKENETLKRHYKELFDSIKITRAKNIEHTTSLIAKNDEFKAQLQEKGFAIAALKNELRKLTGNSVNTKFAKSLVLGKPVSQPHRNQSVVRQPTEKPLEQPRQKPIRNTFPLAQQRLKSELPKGSNADLPNQCESEQALMSVQAPFLNVQKTFEQRSSSLVLHQMTSDHNRSELGIQDHSNEPSSSKLVSKICSPSSSQTATSRQKLELYIFHQTHSNAEDNRQSMFSSKKKDSVRFHVRLPLTLEEKSSNIGFQKLNTIFQEFLDDNS
ncbi:hypothetical protein Tco_1092445 [Tanacetum coccineum]|uniref:Uncharacterized protein n=1 Tax=Tanacetum coccineum TaxID=301880 RepID=A0ABQ5IBV7_9ASTR